MAMTFPPDRAWESKRQAYDAPVSPPQRQIECSIARVRGLNDYAQTSIDRLCAMLERLFGPSVCNQEKEGLPKTAESGEFGELDYQLQMLDSRLLEIINIVSDLEQL